MATEMATENANSHETSTKCTHFLCTGAGVEKNDYRACAQKRAPMRTLLERNSDANSDAQVVPGARRELAGSFGSSHIGPLQADPGGPRASYDFGPS